MYIFSGMDSKHNSKQKPLYSQKSECLYIPTSQADLHEVGWQLGFIIENMLFLSNIQHCIRNFKDEPDSHETLSF